MKFDMILKNAIYQSNKVAYFKREFDQPKWKYEDFNKDFLEPLFDRIQEHKRNILEESEQKKVHLQNLYDAAKLNKVDCYDDYHNKAIDLNIGISLDEYTKQRNKKIVDDYPKMLNELKPEKIRTGRIINFSLRELNTLEDILRELEQTTDRSDKTKKTVTYKQLFRDPKKAEAALIKFRETFPKTLSVKNSYIGNNKGYFPLFIEVLKHFDFIFPHSDIIYKDALNNKIPDLNLSKDASEFRKTYKSISDGIRTDLKLALQGI